MQEALPLESADFSMEVKVESSGTFSTSMFGAAAVFGAVAALMLYNPISKRIVKRKRASIAVSFPDSTL